ncbi:CvpA family protein [Sphingomonas morindae]|uniref:CvpA family protein n=1 Tax=Sphingomonas morindae TaxID=1541170 RepID=A0ABY4XCA0_9SPHN|nr:CvpA family protein [Sphingomonas morindae]USI74582.1 CvpA family protein [Sphingomonas morindae]
MTLLDIVVLLFIGGGAALGLMRGFVWEVLSLFAWVGVVIALKLFYAPATLLLGHYLTTRAGAGLLAFVAVSGLVFFGGRFLAERIGRRTRTSVLGPVDRLLGLGFGAIKGLIGVTLLFMAGNLVYDIGFGGTAARPDWVRTARSYKLLQASRRAIDDLVARRRLGTPADDVAVSNSTDGA